MRHVIEIDDHPDNSRAYWQCDCGAAGSASSAQVEIAAEKHVGEGEQVSHRHPGRRR